MQGEVASAVSRKADDGGVVQRLRREEKSSSSMRDNPSVSFASSLTAPLAQGSQ